MQPRDQTQRSVRCRRNHRGMFEIDVTCTGPDCEEEFQVWVEDLDELDAVVCDSCGHSIATLRVAAYEPELPVRVTRTRRRARSREPAAVR